VAGASDADLVLVGRITAPQGIKGWLKVHSYTVPPTNILDYRPWHLKQANSWQQVVNFQGQLQGKTLVAHCPGCEDRNAAEGYIGAQIYVPQQALPELVAGEYYWRQLQGLRVYNQVGLLLGQVARLMETGANDVLVVEPCEGSIDQRQRLIPYLYQDVVIAVDLAKQLIRVNWDKDF
jgi:16S rRNA processing protein RimM